MKSVLFVFCLTAIAGCVTLKNRSSQTKGGGSDGVHYLCGSEKLGISFQLDNRPEAQFFPVGTKVLVHLGHANPNGEFFSVLGFDAGLDSGVTTLTLGGDFQPELNNLTIQWNGNSIVDDIEITRISGMHENAASDGRCTPSTN